MMSNGIVPDSSTFFYLRWVDKRIAQNYDSIDGTMGFEWKGLVSGRAKVNIESEWVWISRFNRVNKRRGPFSVPRGNERSDGVTLCVYYSSKYFDLLY